MDGPLFVELAKQHLPTAASFALGWLGARGLTVTSASTNLSEPVNIVSFIMFVVAGVFLATIILAQFTGWPILKPPRTD